MSLSISNDKPHEGLMHFLVATACIQRIFLNSYLEFFPDDFVLLRPTDLAELTVLINLYVI